MEGKVERLVSGNGASDGNKQQQQQQQQLEELSLKVQEYLWQQVG